MPLVRAVEPFQITTRGCRFHMHDMAGNAVRCLVWRDALKNRAKFEGLQLNVTDGELFDRYRFEVEDIASTMYDTGYRGAGDDMIVVTSADLTD